jgi:glutathione peroxidase
MFSVLFLIMSLVQSSIYNYQFNSITGETVSMNAYRGKKILLVNIATGSQRATQLTALQELYSTHNDKLVVIGFPSNSFGNESHSNTVIKDICLSQYGVSFPLSAVSPVSGANLSGVYQWFANSNENGTGSFTLTADFQKFLINEQGKLIGIYSPSVLPTDPAIVDAVNSQSE